MDNTRVDLTEYYRGNSLRKGLGRIKKYIVFFGYRCGYTIIPLTPEEPQISPTELAARPIARILTAFKKEKYNKTSKLVYN